MIDITLYGVPVSAFVAKVRIALDHKEIPYQELPPPGGYGSAEYRAIVPAGSVPGITVDGHPGHDSNAIIELLEELKPWPPLLPHDAVDRMFVRSLLGFHDTRMEASVRALFPLVKGDWRGEADKVDAAMAGIRAALERLETIIDPAPHVMGGAFSAGDLAYPCTFQMAEMMAAEMERPLTLHPALAAWRDKTAEVPAVARSLTIHAEAMEAWMAGFRQT